MSRRLGNLNARGLIQLAVDEKSDSDRDDFDVPGYRTLSVLGRGAAGIVYEAERIDDGQIVALKLLSSEHGSDELQRERMKREAQMLAELDHPNLVRVHDFLDLGSTVGISMEIVRGKTLRHLIREIDDEFEIDRATSIITQVADALHTIHGAGLTHRDLKPENILLDRDEQVKLTDLGIAFSEDNAMPRLTLTGMTLGTIGYMSPEQAEGQPIDCRSDIFSLGVVFHELLTGESPDGLLEPPGNYRKDIPEKLDHLVVACLDGEAGNRPQSAAQFLKQLSEVNKQKAWKKLFR